MEALSEALQPYKEIIGKTASTVTILQFLSGGLICYDIYKQRNTRNVSAMPFIGGVVVGLLVLKYAFLLEDKNMFNVNVSAIALNSSYLLVYMAFCEDLKNNVFKPAVKGVCVCLALMFYTLVEDERNLQFRYGLIITIMMLLLLASPLLEAKEMVRNEDASCIPLPLTAMGFLVSILWLLYGIILLNNFMIIQNFMGVLLCSAQLALIYYYPGRKQQTNNLHTD